MQNIFFFRRTIRDELEDEDIEITKEEFKTIRRMLKGKAPHAEFDPHPVGGFVILCQNTIDGV